MVLTEYDEEKWIQTMNEKIHFMELEIRKEKRERERIEKEREKEYNEMADFIKAKRNTDYLAMIDKSMAEAEAGGFIVKTIAELEAYE